MSLHDAAGQEAQGFRLLVVGRGHRGWRREGIRRTDWGVEMAPETLH